MHGRAIGIFIIGLHPEQGIRIGALKALCVELTESLHLVSPRCEHAIAQSDWAMAHTLLLDVLAASPAVGPNALVIHERLALSASE
eukprot:7036855-Prymnesium_polylepis.1